MFYSNKKIKELGYKSNWDFINEYKSLFPEAYKGHSIHPEGVDMFSNVDDCRLIKEKKKKVKAKIFEEHCCHQNLVDFINDNNITRDQIISISMSSDSEAHRRLASVSVNRILLVWEEEV